MDNRYAEVIQSRANFPRLPYSFPKRLFFFSLITACSVSRDIKSGIRQTGGYAPIHIRLEMKFCCSFGMIF